MKKIDFRGKRVVVTGASSGLGREIARSLAFDEQASEIIVAARRRGRLEELKAEIEARSQTRVRVLGIDLETPDSPQSLFRDAMAGGEVFALVNCAGITFYGETLDAPMARYRQIIAVNQTAAMETILLFLRHFLDRGSGAVLVVTSMAAFAPLPYQNVYSATKHALQSFIETLDKEYRGRGVTFSTFVPSGMSTEMLTLAGTDKKFGMDSPFNMKPDVAARKAIRAVRRGRLCTVPGFVNNIGAFIMKRFPKRFTMWALARGMRPERRG
jgi:uncharacterized protein